MTEYGEAYYEEYETRRYSELEEETKEWYMEVLSLAEVSEGDGKGLDIGCAYGHSLDVLHDFGFDPFGMDISEYAIKKGKNIYNFPLVVGDVEEGIPFDGEFSFISMVGVLEHLENPELAISNVYDKLREEGIFVASTPNPDWWRKWFGLAPEDETHKHEWTAEKWRNVLRNFD